MAFKDDMDKIIAKVRRKELALFHAVTAHAYQSIVEGSAVTGAPGQPVDTGALKRSYSMVKEVRRRHSVIRSGLSYAPIIEDNRRGAQLRSKVGGFHSIKMTRVGWRRIVAYEMRKLNMMDGLTSPLTQTVRMQRDDAGRFTGGTETQMDINGR